MTQGGHDASHDAGRIAAVFTEDAEWLAPPEDLILHNEITADGLRPSLTVYFHPIQPEHNAP
ncbi:hypothetical protein [Actinoallomurus soli]|uniref:hypothetical protein n=1 Tax=Actinoallomurus soli TaxID=2952535 RepID=UPI002093089E|nr:hypothetical protein [Actinoallomurus soli]MCO5974366.1 hypothetical protein [Actinoallomurus soli]